MKGNMRPLSIFQIRADSRAKFSQMGLKRMLNMITVVRKSLFKWLVNPTRLTCFVFAHSMVCMCMHGQQAMYNEVV